MFPIIKIEKRVSSDILRFSVYILSYFLVIAHLSLAKRLVQWLSCQFFPFYSIRTVFLSIIDICLDFSVFCPIKCRFQQNKWKHFHQKLHNWLIGRALWPVSSNSQDTTTDFNAWPERSTFHQLCQIFKIQKGIYLIKKVNIVKSKFI